MSQPPGPPPPGEPGSGDSGTSPGYGQLPHPPGQVPGPYSGYPVMTPTNGKATTALIVGITTLVLSWCCGFGVLGLVAIVLGTKARSEIRRSEGRQSGEGVALAGIITGAIALVIGVLVIVALGALLSFGQTSYPINPDAFDDSGDGVLGWSASGGSTSP